MIVLRIRNSNFYVSYSTSLSHSFVINNNLVGCYPKMHANCPSAACYNSKITWLCADISHSKTNELNHNIQFHNKTLQWVLDYPNSDYPYPDIWTLAHVAMCTVPAGKIHCVHWSFATGESKAALRTAFLNATMLFPSSTKLRTL